MIIPAIFIEHGFEADVSFLVFGLHGNVVLFAVLQNDIFLFQVLQSSVDVHDSLCSAAYPWRRDILIQVHYVYQLLPNCVCLLNVCLSP